MTTPVCPSCKSKFSHDTALGCCKVCGLPDKLTVDPELVRAWQRGIARQQRPERKADKKQGQQERVNHKHKYRVLSREKRKHAA